MSARTSSIVKARSGLWLLAVELALTVALRATKASAHRHRPATSREEGYRWPVGPAERQNPAAHGGICTVDTCSCGAERRTNVNGAHVERGEWGHPRGVDVSRRVGVWLDGPAGAPTTRWVVSIEDGDDASDLLGAFLERPAAVAHAEQEAARRGLPLVIDGAIHPVVGWGPCDSCGDVVAPPLEVLCRSCKARLFPGTVAS